MTTEPASNTLGVAEAKSRFSELIDRVQHGEWFMIARRGRPVLALVPPDQVPPPGARTTGLAAVAGALADWPDLEETVQEIMDSRRRARDRAVPVLD